MKKLIVMLALVPMLAIAQSDADNKIAYNKKYTSLEIIKETAEKPSKENALSKYTGHYKSELLPDFEIDLFIEGGKLVGLRKGESEKIEMSFVSPSKFWVKGAEVQIQFLEANGEVQFMSVAKDELNWLVKVN